MYTMRFKSIFRNCFVLLLILSTAVHAYTQPAKSSSIRIDNFQDRISLDVANRPLSQVLLELTQKTGIEIRYLVATESLPNVSLIADNLELSQVLDLLLKDINHMIVQNTSNQTVNPVQVWILGSDHEKNALNLADRPEFQSLDDRSRSQALLHLVSQKALPEEELLATLSQSLINDHNALVRTRAAVGLSQLKSHAALPVLETALRDESQSVRTQVILALGKLDAEQAVNILGSVLNESTDTLDRNLAVRALSMSSLESAQRYLQLAGYDTDRQVRASAKTKSSRVGEK